MPHEAVVFKAVDGRTRCLEIDVDPVLVEVGVDTAAPANERIDFHVEIAMHDPSRLELGVDLQQDILSVRREHDATLPHCVTPRCDERLMEAA